MSSVDDRIVNMQFNNKQFNDGINASQQSLTGLEKSIQNASNSKGLSGLADSVQTATGRFSAMKIAGVTAIATIASRATSAGLNLVKSFTLGPITDGFREFQTNLDSTQTILANTGKPLSVVQAGLDQLNHYSDLTIYNFSQMASAIGKFTAAGVGIKDATNAIKGMANTAALGGASVEQMNTAMYQVSQALASGVIRLQDWNSLVNANMGGKNVQNALKATAESVGTNVDALVKKTGSFRESLREGWLTADVFNKTMKVMAGTTDKATGATVAFSVAQLKEMGYTEAQAKSLHKLSQASIDSATKIKSLPQLMGVVREAIGSVWSTTFRGIFGNLRQSQRLWTKVGDKLTGPQGVVTKFGGGIANMLDSWKAAGGRKAIIDGFGTAFSNLGKVLSTVKMAFKDVFPPGAGTALGEMSVGFANLMHQLTPGAKTLESLRSIFGGVFAVLHIGFTIVKAIGAAFGGFFGAISGGAGNAGGGILEVAAKIGEMLKAADKFLTSGGKMVDLFNKIGTAAGGFVGKGLGIATDLIRGIVSGLDPSSIKAAMVTLATNIIDSIKNALGIHSPAASMVPVGLAIVQGIVNGITGAIGIVFEGIGKIAGAILTGFGHMFSGMNALDFAALLNAVLTSALLVTFNKISKTVLDFRQFIQTTMDQVTKTFGAMQNVLNAEALKRIAIAIGIIAASVIALSFVDAKKLGVALAAIGGLFYAINKTLGSIQDLSDGELSSKQLLSLGITMQLLATSILTLSGAIAILAQLNVKQLVAGVVALKAVMTIMTTSLTTLAGLGPLAKGAGSAMLLFAVALNLVAGAVALFGNMDPTTLAVGMLAVATAMKLFTNVLGTLTALGPGVGAAGGAIFLMAAAMAVLAGAVAAFGNMDMGTLVKGFVAVGVAIGIFVVALKTLGTNLEGTVAAAGAMLLMATAMSLLVPAILALGSMDFWSLVKGLAGIAAVMVIFTAGLAAMAAVAVIAGPALLILGGALALIGVGMAAFGAGFALLAATGTAGIAVMTAAITAFIGLLPAIALQLAAAFVQFFAVIAEAAPRLRESFGVIFANAIGVITDNIPVIGAAVSLLIAELLNVVIRAIPQVGNVFKALIKTALSVVRSAGSGMIDTAWFLIMKFITSIRNHISDVANTAGDIIAAWIRALGKQAAKIADAAADAIIDFINGVTKAIDEHSTELGEAGARMGLAIVKGMVKGISGAAGEVVGAVKDMAGGAIKGGLHKLGIGSPSKEFAKQGRWVVLGFVQGVNTYARSAEQATGDMAAGVLDKMAISLQRMTDMVPTEMDITPSITPVLDLTNIQKDASKIGSLLTPSPVMADVSFQQAAQISTAQQKAREESSSNGQNGSRNGPVEVKLEQNNYSPKALSTLEIYRRTGNQLSQVKTALGIVDEDRPQ